MMKEINKVDLFPSSIQGNRGLLNLFNQTKATPEQSFDMLNFRDIGSQNLENFINHFLLQHPSTIAPVRKNKLLTMVPVKKINKRAMNQKDKELTQITKCLRQRLTWCNRTGQSYNSTIEQYSLYPRAITDEEGCPLKGAKSVWKDKLGRRYPGPELQVVMGSLPQQWNPDTAVDGMFFLNCELLRNVTSIREYSNFLFNRFVLPQYQSQVSEVHLLFDSKINDGTFNPKAFEQKKKRQWQRCISPHPRNIHSFNEYSSTMEIIY